jgi:hypothetical protein
MKSPTPLASLMAALALTSAPAWAGPVGATVNATVRPTIGAVQGTAQSALNVPVAVGSTVNPAGAIGAASFTPTISASTAMRNSPAVSAHGATGAAAASGLTPMNPADVSNNLIVGTDAESIGMRRERFRLQQEAAERAQAGAGRASVSASQAGALSFDATPTARAIEQASVERQDELAGKIADQIDAGRRAVAHAGKQARALEGQARDHFDAVREEVAAREEQLEDSAKAAKRASADTWEDARAQLATDYAAYVEAVKRAQLSATADLTGSAAGSSLAGTATVSTPQISYDARETADGIRSAAFATRDQLAGAIDTGIARGRDKLDLLRNRADELDDRAQARFDDASHLAQIRERQLKTTLLAAQRADADAWSDARERLAADYQAYAEALRQAETASSASGVLSATTSRQGASVSGNLAVHDED